MWRQGARSLVCPETPRLDGQRAVIGDACRGCGRCVAVCPEQAIALSIDDARFVEQSIARLSRLVDVS